MKLTLRTLLIGAVAIVGAGFVSCSDDNFTDTIFSTDPSQDYLDKKAYTFPLDTFCKKEFLEPYNMRFNFKFDDRGSDMTKNLTPAEYSKSVDLAVLTKYLWYDIYTKLAGEEFLKKYSPRIIQVTGSKNLNPSQGTEVLGDAAQGVKMNLYNANNLNPDNINVMNEYFFKTMHHEFAHILDHKFLRPTAFNVVSNGRYDAAGWSDVPDSISAGSGFVSSYASSAAVEDWAETLAHYVTRDSLSWNQLMESSRYDWEQNDTGMKQSEFFDKYGLGNDTIGYYKAGDNGKNKIYRRVCLRDEQGNVIKDAEGKVQWLKRSGIDGRAVILQKVDIVRAYLKEHYKIDIDALRKEVQNRTYVTNADGTFPLDIYGMLQNKLTSVQPSGKTLMEELREQVNKFKSLQQ